MCWPTDRNLLNKVRGGDWSSCWCFMRVLTSTSWASSVRPLSLLYTAVWEVKHPWTYNSKMEDNLCIQIKCLRETDLSLTMYSIPVVGWFISRKMTWNCRNFDVIFYPHTLPARTYLREVNHRQTIRWHNSYSLRYKINSKTEVILSHSVLESLEHG